MESYNRQDTELLEQLYNRLHKYIAGHPSHAAFHGRDICPQCGSGDLRPAGLAYLKTGQYPRFVCGSCGTYARATRRSGATSITSA
jgi:ribosomal protein S27AE